MSASIYPTLSGASISIDRTMIFDTTVQRESSGRELRISRTTAPRYRYSINYEFLRQDYAGDELATLTNFLDAHRGAWDSFLFTDPKDSTVTTGAFGTGDGVTTVFYLRDEMGDRIGACNGTPLIYKGGVLQTITTHYTQDLTTGKITFVAAPAGAVALTWTGSWYRRVRFSEDSIQVQRWCSRVWKASVELFSVLP